MLISEGFIAACDAKSSVWGLFLAEERKNRIDVNEAEKSMLDRQPTVREAVVPGLAEGQVEMLGLKTFNFN